MDWLFHILVALLFYNAHFQLEWYLIGSVILDIFVIISIFQYSGFNYRKITSALDDHVDLEGHFAHKVCHFCHGLPFFSIVVLISIFSNFLPLKSMAFGMSIHIFVDFWTHKPNRNPLFYPFSKRIFDTGLINWSFRNKKHVIYGLIIMVILFLIKYTLFGFIL